MRGAKKMAFLIISTLVAGFICFMIGYRAGLGEGLNRLGKLKKEYEIFSRRYDAVMKFISTLIEEELGGK